MGVSGLALSHIAETHSAMNLGGEKGISCVSPEASTDQPDFPDQAVSGCQSASTHLAVENHLLVTLAYVGQGQALDLPNLDC